MNLIEALSDGLKQVTRHFTRAKMQAHGRRKERISQEQLDRLENKRAEKQLKAAAYEVIPQAYALVSDNGRLPANKRQIMYQARPLVMALTGGKFWKDTQTFTQTVLRDFINDNPELTQDWDVVADERGHFREPHTRKQIGLGTLAVRGYVKSWENNPDLTIKIDGAYPTQGPHNRYKFALFIEKEGFDPLLERAQIEKRYDLSIFSSKGQTNAATRQLVENLSKNGVTILRATDFDKAAISIGHWLFHSNETYQFKHEPKVINLGLRLADVKAMGLDSEEQIHFQRKDPTENFQDWEDCDLTDEEADFLRGEYRYIAHEGRMGWVGRRVELNAMTSPQHIVWLEKKLDEAGVEKVVPDRDTLTLAWHRALKIARARKTIDEEETAHVVMPKDLKKKVCAMLKRHPALSWDEALAQIAHEHLDQ
jgi:Topoisomerase 6 subunit A/Spo11, Toprim domain